MSAYLVGNLVGRLLVSYALVWLVLWLLFSQRRWREAFRKTHRWYGLLTIAAVFLFGVLAAASKGTLS